MERENEFFAHAFCLSVTDRVDSVAGCFVTTVDATDPLDGLILCAGIDCSLVNACSPTEHATTAHLLSPLTCFLPLLITCQRVPSRDNFYSLHNNTTQHSYGNQVSFTLSE